MTDLKKLDVYVPEFFHIIYPNGGTAENISTVKVSNNYVENNPFSEDHVICEPQILINGKWGNPKWIYSSPSGSFGVEASQLGDKIVIQTGSASLKAYSINSGDPFNLSENVQEAPCRVLVRKIN